jgi:hypothetical protein
MKTINKFFLLAALVLVISNAKAQSNKDDMMKAMMAYMTPGDAQKMMSKSVGDWKVETMMWMDPSQPPQKSTGTSHNEMIMGDRYLTTRFKGDMMGMPFEGLGTIGYDNAKKMYVSTWVDNMGTGIMTMEGKRSEDGKSIEFRGKGYDPSIGKEVMMRQVNTFIDDSHQKIEMYQKGSDKEKKVMEINLTR